VDRERLERYTALVGAWPGLVSGPPGPLVEDCLVLLDHLGDARTVVDVGSGGGMPGLPLKIARPDLDVTLLEADQRKAAFLVDACARLALDVRVVAERAEAAGRGPLRESFDLAVCRALAAMPVLAELCLPLVRVGGRLLAMKGRVEDAEAAIAALGGGPPAAAPAASAARAQGVVVTIAKLAPTPAAYPRRPGLPNRRPLGA
jgi:16S rRNA (guanine527-N7)-methyltransferase